MTISVGYCSVMPHQTTSIILDEETKARIAAATKHEADKAGQNVSQSYMLRLFIKRGLADWERRRK